ncbi:MAG: glycoside hydrolase [Nitrospinae bacterium]|nr:glycoside hydrolase [Nitrospinota bacterium]
MLTDELVEEIKREEGFVPVVYLDARSKKTIGYGTLLEDGISEAEAELLLRHRLSLMGRELENSRVGEVYENLRPGARRAVLNMAYNMGVPNLLGFRKMWAALAEGDYARAASEALDSVYARDLPARAGRVADSMRSA